MGLLFEPFYSTIMLGSIIKIFKMELECMSKSIELPKRIRGKYQSKFKSIRA